MTNARVKVVTPTWSLARCTETAAWNDFVRRSPQGTIFCQTAFLDALPVKYELWQVVDARGRAQVGAVLLRDEDGLVIAQPYAFSLYQGVLLEGDLASLPAHRSVLWALSAVSFLLTELSHREERLSFCLHHSWRDTRSFSWFNYQEPSAGQFGVAVRQTGLIELAGHTFDDYLAGIRKSRRQEFSSARSRFKATPSDDVEALLRLYLQTFGRQGVVVSVSTVSLVRSITEAALASGFGELLLARSLDGEPISATLFLYDHSCGYYLFGATDPRFRAAGVGTYTFLMSLQHCLARGIAQVDVAGVNSPQRGDFKISFNAQPTPFYVVDCTKGH